MRALTHVLGDPQATYPVIHLTGTNGKGSVGHLLGRLLVGSGLSVGGYSSPHVEQLNERITWNGDPIPDAELARVVGELAAVEGLVGHPLSWFEMVTATAFQWFADVVVDAAVIEVGLLGRHDATNVADAAVAVVTNIGRDHTDLRHGWQQAVAREKAGIIKEGSDLVLGRVDPGLQPELTAVARGVVWRLGQEFDVVERRVGVGGQLLSLRTPHGAHDEVFLPLHGDHQADNAAVALAAAEVFFGRPVERDVVEEAFGGAALAGRFEVVSHHPLVVLDVAHNPDGAEATARTLADEFNAVGSRIIVVGLLDGRDPAQMLESLGARNADLVIVARPTGPRAMEPERLLAAAAELGVATEPGGSPEESLHRALSVAADEDVVLVTGSFQVVGPARTAWRRRSGGSDPTA